MQHLQRPRGAQVQEAGLAVVAHATHGLAQTLAGQSVQQRLQLAAQHAAHRHQPRAAALERRHLGGQPGRHQLQPVAAAAAQAAQLGALLGVQPLAFGQAAPRRLVQGRDALLDDADVVEIRPVISGGAA